MVSATRMLLTLALAAGLAPAADNQLTPGEQRAGWKLMFDGNSFRNWRDPAKLTPPGDSWVIEGGCLRARPAPRIREDLFSEESFGDFEFKFDWRLPPGGNSGVKYRIQRSVFMDFTKVQPGEGGWEGQVFRELTSPKSVRSKMAPEATANEFALGFEFQLVDDERDPGARSDPRTATGALYSMIAPTARAARPIGEWNQSLFVVQGDRIEHWINGVKVLEGSLNSEDVRAGAQQRWGRYPILVEMFTKPKPAGFVCLQHHTTGAWFRNLKIRRTGSGRSVRNAP